MSGITYRIVLKNESPDNNRYMLFQDPPEVSKNLGKAWSNVWVLTGGTPTPHGKQDFKITTHNFAVTGTTEEPLAKGVSVTESDSAEVQLTSQTKGGTMPQLQIKSDTPEFFQPYEEVRLPNSFGIKTSGWDPSRYPYVYCGYGKQDKAGSVVPVAVWPAKPNHTYELTPNVTYYIATGSYAPGQVLDITTLGKVASIDFSKAKSGQTIATITHKHDYTYSDPVFEYPPTQKENEKDAHYGFGH